MPWGQARRRPHLRRGVRLALRAWPALGGVHALDRGRPRGRGRVAAWRCPARQLLRDRSRGCLHWVAAAVQRLCGRLAHLLTLCQPGSIRRQCAAAIAFPLPLQMMPSSSGVGSHLRHGVVPVTSWAARHILHRDVCPRATATTQLRLARGAVARLPLCSAVLPRCPSTSLLTGLGGGILGALTLGRAPDSAFTPSRWNRRVGALGRWSRGWHRAVFTRAVRSQGSLGSSLCCGLPIVVAPL